MKSTVLVSALLMAGALAHADQSPREQAEAAVRQEMAKAQAEKARNDRIVERQRAEKAERSRDAARAEKARRDTERFEKADRKARTG
jgi:hypothetical protein